MSRSDAHDETLQASPRSTIEPPRETIDDAGQGAVVRLARMQRGALTIEGPLGEGGMGLVQLATQSALGRKVAVKTVRPAQHSAANTMQLLREAWVAGSLEHPNVVPIYDVSLDAAGTPVVVMRRIEGTEWSALMLEAEEVARRFGAHDLLEWNLRVLIQLCNAVHFAHQRGIVHRDLKPDNVMLGELGEVYLLDWGIAIAVKDDGSGRLPLREHAHQVAGTPAYMAPEMWTGEPSQLTERTDVYLLGAILYEILTGRPPHSGKTLAELREQAASPPRLPDSPRGLVEICGRALDVDPARRFESALELRHALVRFLEEQEAERLVDEARRGLAVLQAALTATPSVHAEIYNRFGACRFGFEQAIARASDAAGAREGLLAATRLMIEYELRAGDARAARTLLSALPAAPPELGERVAAAERASAEAEEKRRALEALGRDWDIEVGARTRLFVGLCVSVLWSVLPILGAVTDLWPKTYPAYLSLAAAFLVASMGMVYWARESLLRTQLNRSLLGAALLLPSALIMLILGSWLAGAPLHDVMRTAPYGWFLISAVLGAVIDPRLYVSSAAYLLAFFLIARWPASFPAAIAVANMILTGTLLWMWLPALKGRIFRR